MGCGCWGPGVTGGLLYPQAVDGQMQSMALRGPDGEPQPGLESQGRAASMPRLAAETQVGGLEGRGVGLRSGMETALLGWGLPIALQPGHSQPRWATPEHNAGHGVRPGQQRPHCPPVLSLLWGHVGICPRPESLAWRAPLSGTRPSLPSPVRPPQLGPPFSPLQKIDRQVQGAPEMGLNVRKRCGWSIWCFLF